MNLPQHGPSSDTSGILQKSLESLATHKRDLEKEKIRLKETMHSINQQLSKVEEARKTIRALVDVYDYDGFTFQTALQLFNLASVSQPKRPTQKGMALEILTDVHPDGLTLQEIVGRAERRYSAKIKKQTISVMLGRLSQAGDVHFDIDGKVWRATKGNPPSPEDTEEGGEVAGA